MKECRQSDGKYIEEIEYSIYMQENRLVVEEVATLSFECEKMTELQREVHHNFIDCLFDSDFKCHFTI